MQKYTYFFFNSHFFKGVALIKKNTCLLKYFFCTRFRFKKKTFVKKKKIFFLGGQSLSRAKKVKNVPGQDHEVLALGLIWANLKRVEARFSIFFIFKGGHHMVQC